MNLSVVLITVMLVDQVDYGPHVTLARETELALEVEPYQSTLVERAPLVLRIRLRNVGGRTVHTFFKSGRHLRYVQRFSLHAIAESGQTVVVKRLQFLHANMTGAPGAPLEPGQVLETEETLCLKIAGSDAEFLSPGRYGVSATLECPPLIRSNEFSLTVVPATGADARALQVLDTLPYYAQGELRRPKPQDTWALGGKPEEIRARLDGITKELGDSVFAFWVQYWETFHALEGTDMEWNSAASRALAFADEHPTFPLTDNLLVRLGHGLVRQRDLAGAERLLERLDKDFAKSDSAAEDIPDLRRQVDELRVRSARPNVERRP